MHKGTCIDLSLVRRLMRALVKRLRGTWNPKTLSAVSTVPYLTSKARPYVRASTRKDTATKYRDLLHSPPGLALLHLCGRLLACDKSKMLRRPLCLTPRLVRQHFVRNSYAICSPHGYQVQWQRVISSATSTSTDSPKASPKPKRYSAEEDSTILEMRALKYDGNSIASALAHRRADAVRRRDYKHLKDLATVSCQNHKKRFTTEDIATIRDMLARGHYMTAIARKLGRSYTSIYNYCHKAGLQSFRPTLDSITTGTKHAITRKLWTRAEIDRLLDLHATGLKPGAVARELGRSVQTVRRKIMCHLPYRDQATRLVTTGPEGDSVAASRARLRRVWTKEDDEKFVELVADGVGFERIASIFDRRVSAVKTRWRIVLQPRCKYQKSIGGPSDSSASSEQKQSQQVVPNVTQLDPQSRRNFTTLHGGDPNLAINLQNQSALTYSSHRLVRAAPWKRYGSFSLPYRPQQRFEHTISNPVPRTKRSGNYQRYSEEDISQIIELRARQYPYTKIGEIMGRPRGSVQGRATSSLKEERWRKKYEEVRAAVPDDQKYYGVRKDMKARSSRRHAFSTEEHERLLGLRARDHSWEDIGKALERNGGRVRLEFIALLEDERWRQRFEAVRSTVPDEERLSRYKVNPPYTAEEDAVISNMRKAGSSYRLIAEAIGRSASSVGCRWARRLDVSDPVVRIHRAKQAQQPFGRFGVPKHHRFTAEEDSRLRHMLSLGVKPREMTMALGTASIDAIKRRLKLLQAHPADRATLEPWSDVEIQNLRFAIANRKHVSEFQQLFPSRSTRALREMCRRLRLPTIGVFTKRLPMNWTPAQDAELLRDRAAGKPHKAIAASLGKTISSCWKRLRRLQEAHRLGRTQVNDEHDMAIRVGKHPRHWTPAQDAELLRSRAAGKPHEAIAASLGKTVSSCQSRLHRLPTREDTGQ